MDPIDWTEIINPAIKESAGAKQHTRSLNAQNRIESAEVVSVTFAGERMGNRLKNCSPCQEAHKDSSNFKFRM
jgi:hypothetical protein